MASSNLANVANDPMYGVSNCYEVDPLVISWRYLLGEKMSQNIIRIMYDNLPGASVINAKSLLAKSF